LVSGCVDDEPVLPLPCWVEDGPVAVDEPLVPVVDD